ncbi:BppU family phage baseplate upper protein [Bacillus sp. 0209A]|uniref:phage baseplate upper protein n=1 Tax=Bacillus sp. 0209A TaxID=3120562 RepID=UPI002FDA26F9
MIYKDAAISANVGTSSSSRTTNIHFSTQDIGTAKLIFKVFKDGVPLPLSAVTGKLVMVMTDGSKFIKNITIVDRLKGIAEYVLTSEEIKHYGKVQASLNLYYDNKQSLGITQFTFQIDKNLIDSDIVPIAEYYIEDFETLRQSVEAIVADLQEKFKDLDNVETKAGSQEKADAVQTNLDTHTRDKSNPHGVTKSQIGLGNVDNVQQASKQDFDLHVSDAAKHISSSERTKWNNGQTFRITAENGTQKYNLTQGSFYDSLKDVGTVSFYGTNAVTDNPSSSSLRGMQIVGQPGIGMGYAVDVNGNAWWFYYNSSHTKINWFPAESITGAQSKVDAHANRKDNPHAVTKAQVGLDKVDNVQQAPLTEFNAHNYNPIRHITQIEREKWNGGQLTKITNDVGGVAFAVNEGEDMLQAIVNRGRSMGTFYANGKAVNSPSSASTRGFYQMTSQSTDGKGMYGWVYAMDYRNNVFTNYYDGNSSGWTGWKQLDTSKNFENAIWQNVTLKNGASTGDRTFQYAKWGNLLLLRGHITATREVVCGSIPSDGLPTNGAVAMVLVSGTTGYSKLFVYSSGDMKLTGIHSNNDSAVTGYYMDAVIPLN